MCGRPESPAECPDWEDEHCRLSFSGIFEILRFSVSFGVIRSARNTSPAPNQVTLSRALSKLGFSSRSRAEQLISAGLVKVNGIVRKDPGRWVDLLKDGIRVEGKEAPRSAHRVLAFHKPAGLVTSRRDERSRKTVFDFIGREADGLIAVGRLDMDSSGLLLLTNDHALADLLTDPAGDVPKRYLVELDAPLTDAAMETFSNGVEISLRGKPYLTKTGTIQRRSKTEYEIEIREGKNRQIRRMIQTLGCSVKALKRLSVGPVELEDLPEGKWRILSEGELSRLRQIAKPTNRPRGS
ncbi:MAG TPA: pseudouridine synthase [Bacteroidota bacterium]|nr:pseudouridine synthase [Bacteroidota bacterium]